MQLFFRVLFKNLAPPPSPLHLSETLTVKLAAGLKKANLADFVWDFRAKWMTGISHILRCTQCKECKTRKSEEKTSSLNPQLAKRGKNAPVIRFSSQYFPSPPRKCLLGQLDMGPDSFLQLQARVVRNQTVSHGTHVTGV